MATEQIAIYGGGGFAREVAWLVEACNESEPRYQLVGFIDDKLSAQGTRLNDIPVMALEEMHTRFPAAKIVGGVGAPKVRELLMEKCAALGFAFATVIHPRVERSRWVETGEGTVICAGNILTTNIKLGQHVQLNLDCTIGHDAILGDYTSLAPGVHVSGWVHFGKRVYVGTGAVIINGVPEAPIHIGDDAVIGAGACVTKSVPPGVTVVGVPARPLQRRPQ
ncbi:MAG TPA: acetyltransferase [Blastocatellia bacterium]|nr:acetyltransferase [Blastocatellia bacterium]